MEHKRIMSLETYKKYIQNYLDDKKYTKRHGKILFRERYSIYYSIRSSWEDKILFADGFVLYVTIDGHDGHFFRVINKAKKYSNRTVDKILKDNSFKVLDDMAMPDMYW